MSERYGVVIGVNACGPHTRVPALRFAEADARDIFTLLTNEVTGTFDSAAVTLLTGRNATTSAVKAALRESALQMSPSDTLFVYFAGHTLISPWLRHSDPYLVTTDLSTDLLKTDPDHGLRMSFLKRDIFDITQGSSFLILDTCHAGAYLEFEKTDGIPLARINIDSLDETREMRLPANYGGLFASTADSITRESAEFRHGILTHHVLKALQGEAANQVGEVTFEAVVDYVRKQDIDPEPGSVTQGWGQANVLVNLGAKKLDREDSNVTPRTRHVVTIEPLANPLDPYSSAIQALLDRAFRPSLDRTAAHAGTDTKARLELIRHAVDATAAVEIDASSGQVLATVGNYPSEALSNSLIDRITKVSDKGSALGFTCTQLEDRGFQLMTALPDDHSNSKSALLIVNPAPTFLRTGEPVATVLRSLWNQGANDPLLAELNALSAIRSKFGRLPIQIYQAGFDIYSKLLKSMVMVFEPVMVLSDKPRKVGIHSWEALARRDSSARRAPIEILRMAEIWGDQFVLERDITLAAKAISSYSQAHDQGPWNQDTPKPISVNVSVRSLLRGSYERALKHIVSEAGMAPHTITLEISEGDAIEPLSGEDDWGPAPLTFFRNRLRQLSETLRVNFAIDDFGVGHASLDRVSSLDLTQIKVDRAILHHRMAMKELELVVQLANDALERGHSATSRVVVVEGVDSESPISLSDLRRLGINYVQGYITGGPAKASLEPLSETVRQKVASQVRGEA